MTGTPDEPRDAGQPRPRHRDLDEIFGDVLPATTSDERDSDSAGERDSWYERNRPPHHDR